MLTWGVFSSGVNLRFQPSTKSMYSLCVTTVPQVEYRSVRKYGVPSKYSSTVVALGLKPSILPHRDLNSASVISDVQQSASASVPLLAGVKGVVHLDANSVLFRISVVVCKSQCECRHTNCLSLVKATSHSITPAPILLAAE